MRGALTWLKDAWLKLTSRDRGVTSQLGRRIEEHGWTAVYVGDYSTAPTWTYTIGFDETLGQPEVIVFDIPQDSANALLWEVFTQIKEGRPSGPRAIFSVKSTWDCSLKRKLSV